jgi:hypothetical protein
LGIDFTGRRLLVVNCGGGVPERHDLQRGFF